MYLTIVSASRQNAFFDELLDAVEYAVAAAGVPVRRQVDCFPDPEEGEVFLFVPHEYVALTEPESHPGPGHLARTVAFQTEQPGTQWFEIALDWCRRSAATVDLNVSGAHALRLRGIQASHVPIGYTPGWDAWGGDSESARDLDVVVLAGHTPRRASSLARLAPTLSRLRCHLTVSDGTSPIQAGDPGVLFGEALSRHLARARIVLNVHRSELAYFEWHRAVRAAINGAVFVTEHSLDADPLRPGRDYVAASEHSLPHVIELLLGDDGMRQRLQRSARERLMSIRPPEVLARELMPVLDRVSLAAMGSVRRPSTPATPRPKERVRPIPYSQLPNESPKDDVQVLLRLVKRLSLSEMEHARRLRHLESLLTGRRGEDLDEHPLGPPQDAPPEVSVVTTVYNRAHLVGEAIRSLAFSTHRSFEVVVVDDGSTDSSAQSVVEAFQSYPWLSGRLVRRTVNAGLPAARNLGVQRSRGELVFILDDDNTVYPRCLEVLAGPLREDPSLAFTYGILQAFDHAGPAALVSWPAWDPRRLRYGNFVDAMAMLRRSTLLEVGGYRTDPTIHGWEDYDLWCRFAEEGRRGLQVPEMVGRYRVSRLGMLDFTNVDTTDAWQSLVERYPFLTEGGAAYADGGAALEAAQ